MKNVSLSPNDQILHSVSLIFRLPLLNDNFFPQLINGTSQSCIYHHHPCQCNLLIHQDLLSNVIKIQIPLIQASIYGSRTKFITVPSRFISLCIPFTKNDSILGNMNPHRQMNTSSPNLIEYSLNPPLILPNETYLVPNYLECVNLARNPFS